MRRTLHSLLIGVLTFSLSIDSARACWHLRRACRVEACRPVECVPVVACGVAPCGSWAVPVPVVIDETPRWVGESAGCCGAVTDVSEPVVVAVTEAPVAAADVVAEPRPETSSAAPLTTAEPPATGESVVAPAPTPEAERPAVKPEIVAAAPVEPQLPDLQPAPQPPADLVKPASNDEPALEPAPPARDREEEPADQPEPPAVPKEENLFEKVERRADAEPAVEPAVPAAESAPATGDAPAVDADGDAKPADASDDSLPGKDPVEDPVEPAPAADAPAADAEPEEPAAEPADADEPAADTAAREPLRRWIDASGSYAVVGELVAVAADRVAIRRNDGREISVPLDKLSEHDRAYARGAGERLAAHRQVVPASGDTAGL